LGGAPEPESMPSGSTGGGALQGDREQPISHFTTGRLPILKVGILHKLITHNV
jgi:hypothetical protein